MTDRHSLAGADDQRANHKDRHWPRSSAVFGYATAGRRTSLTIPTTANQTNDVRKRHAPSSIPQPEMLMSLAWAAAIAGVGSCVGTPTVTTPYASPMTNTPTAKAIKISGCRQRIRIALVA